MTYVDALHCLEQVNSGNALAPANAAPSEGDAKRKPARSKSGQGNP
jgi:hypothetical protein